MTEFSFYIFTLHSKMVLLKYSLLGFILSCLFIRGDSYVNGITKYNIRSYTETNKFLIIFVDAPSCTRCRKMYKNFVAAAEPFNGDREIFFGRTTEISLKREWEIEELPAIIYFMMGQNKPRKYEGDLTVEGIFNAVADAMKGDFSGLKKVYHIDVNEDNYEELIIKPEQHAMLLIYDQYHEEQRNTMAEIGKIFNEDDDVVIAVLDADKHKTFRNKKFNFPGAPLLYWFPLNDKYSIKRFGGDLTFEVILAFINEHTNCWRSKDGTLSPQAGRFVSIDSIIEDQIADILTFDSDIMDKVIEKVEEKVKTLLPNEVVYGNYYLFLLHQMKSSQNTDVFVSETDRIFSELHNLDLPASRTNFFVRHHHILEFFVKSTTEFMSRNPKYRDDMVARTEANKQKRTHDHEHDEL